MQIQVNTDANIKGRDDVVRRIEAEINAALITSAIRSPGSKSISATRTPASLAVSTNVASWRLDGPTVSR